MAVNVPGLISIIIFYLLIVAVGVWAAWRNRNKGSGSGAETIMVAGRDIGFLVGSFTMTATWVGGGYINGTAEYVYTPGFGLLWTQAPFGYSISLFLGGLFFAKKMREQNFVTMLDPLQQKFGKVMVAFLYIPALLGDLFWSGAILASLGGALTVIAGLDHYIAIIVSALIAIMYTLIGGLYSVAYTDVVQLICIFIGLWISVPFAFTNDAVSSIAETAYSSGPDTPNWLGTWDNNYAGLWVDSALLLIFGGIPWQVYFQRVLSSKTVWNAQLLSFIAAFGCIVMAVPSILIGAIAASTNWTATDYVLVSNGLDPFANNQSTIILPIVLQYLTHPAVSFIGLGAVSAAVMSSADSSILSASSMFTKNVYQNIRQSASDTELIWVMRVSIFLVGAGASALAIFIDSIYVLWFLCGDLVFVVLFPQLLCTLYADPNTYGSIIAFVVALVLRLGGGEPLIGFKAFIPYPGNVDGETAYFPYKTFAMVLSLICLLAFSQLFKELFVRGVIPAKYDFLGCNLAQGGRSYKNPDLELESSKKNTGLDNVGYSPDVAEPVEDEKAM